MYKERRRIVLVVPLSKSSNTDNFIILFPFFFFLEIAVLRRYNGAARQIGWRSARTFESELKLRIQKRVARRKKTNEPVVRDGLDCNWFTGEPSKKDYRGFRENGQRSVTIAVCFLAAATLFSFTDSRKYPGASGENCIAQKTQFPASWNASFANRNSIPREI